MSKRSYAEVVKGEHGGKWEDGAPGQPVIKHAHQVFKYTDVNKATSPKGSTSPCKKKRSPRKG